MSFSPEHFNSNFYIMGMKSDRLFFKNRKEKLLFTIMEIIA